MDQMVSFIRLLLRIKKLVGLLFALLKEKPEGVLVRLGVELLLVALFFWLGLR